MDTFKYYEDMNYKGTDASLETSLFEYGLVWGTNEHCKEKDEYHFIYLSTITPAGKNLFGSAYFTKKDFEELLDEDWVRLDSVLEYAGQTKTDFLNNFPYSVCDVIAYYGTANVLGFECNPFTIENIQ